MLAAFRADVGRDRWASEARSRAVPAPASLYLRPPSSNHDANESFGIHNTGVRTVLKRMQGTRRSW